MKIRYGVLPDADFDLYKKRLHSLIHWLLVYADENNPCLDSYFQKVQVKLAGLSSLMENDSSIVELMILVESARVLAEAKNYNSRMYKKLILDAHEIIERIFNG